MIISAKRSAISVKQRIATALILAGLWATVEGSARGGQLFGGGAVSRALYSIDLDTGARTPIAVTGDWTRNGLFSTAPVNGLAYNTEDHHLYATVHATSSNRDPNIRNDLTIFRINPADFTVERFQIGGLPSDFSSFTSLDGLEYDSRRNLFWTIDVQTRQLLRIDPTTFQATSVGALQPSLIGGLAYDRATDTLYGVDDWPSQSSGSESRLVAIDIDTLALSYIGPPGLGLQLGDLDSLTFDPAERYLYSINDGGNAAGPPPTQQLVRIDPVTGIATAIGPPDHSYELYQGLAFVVPEPASLFLWAILVAVELLYHRRCSFVFP
jgi:hypothetical protein